MQLNGFDYLIILFNIVIITVVILLLILQKLQHQEPLSAQPYTASPLSFLGDPPTAKAYRFGGSRMSARKKGVTRGL